MTYIENPKTKGSGILCCIPQEGRCPVGCDDCFFQSGRSYLEPLNENLPNMPSPEMAAGRVVRVNDGNDSNVDREHVIEATAGYPMRFFNTSRSERVAEFPGPVVLTVNPGKKTDKHFRVIDRPPPNLMFVRVRANTWNRVLQNLTILHYAEVGVPVVLTWMAYFDTADKIPEEHRKNYQFRKRTLNSYWAITTEAWERCMAPHRHNKWVYSCGKIEGELGTTACRHCGNCLREYFATMERIRSTFS